MLLDALFHHKSTLKTGMAILHSLIFQGTCDHDTSSQGVYGVLLNNSFHKLSFKKPRV